MIFLSIFADRVPKNMIVQVTGVDMGDVDNAVISALSWNQFLKILAQQGYQFQLHRKYITLQPPGNARPVRFKTLGRNYTPEAIHRRILAPKRRRTTWINPSFSQIKLKGKSPRKLTGLQALYSLP